MRASSSIACNHLTTSSGTPSRTHPKCMSPLDTESNARRMSKDEIPIEVSMCSACSIAFTSCDSAVSVPLCARKPCCADWMWSSCCSVWATPVSSQTRWMRFTISLLQSFRNVSTSPNGLKSSTRQIPVPPSTFFGIGCCHFNFHSSGVSLPSHMSHSN